MKITIIIVAFLIAVLIVILGYLLIAPVTFRLDSETMSGSIGWNRWLRGKLRIRDDLTMDLSAPFWKRTLKLEDLLIRKRHLPQNVEEEPKKETRKSGRKKGMKRMSWSRFKRMIRAVKIKEFRLNLDTDDFIWNAYLTPVFENLRYWRGYNIRINFMGRTEMRLVAEVRLIELLVRGWRK